MNIHPRLLVVLLTVPLMHSVAERPAVPVPYMDCPQTPGQVVMDLVNAERVAQGLPRLHVDVRLARAAVAHAKDLSTGQESGHVGSDGSGPSQRADRSGYPWTLIGENVAAGLVEPREVVTGWMGSPPHRHNILDIRFTDAAVGYEPEAASRWGTYWVMVFGTTARPDTGRRGQCNP